MDAHEAWEGWVRPVLLIAVAAAAGALWALDVVADRPFALGAGAVIMAAAGGLALQGYFEAVKDRLRRTLAVVVVVGAAALAGGVAWTHLTEPLVHGELADAAATLPIPPTGEGADRYVVYVHGRPAAGATKAGVTVHLATGADAKRHSHAGDLTSTRTGGMSPKPTGKDKHDIAWRLEADLSQSAAVSAGPNDKTGVTWPLTVEIQRQPPPLQTLALLALPLLLLGVLLDGTCGRRPATRLGVVAAAAALLGPAIDQFFAPGGLTKALLGGVMASALLGAVVALVLTAVVRAWSKGPTPEGADARERTS